MNLLTWKEDRDCGWCATYGDLEFNIDETAHGWTVCMDDAEMAEAASIPIAKRFCECLARDYDWLAAENDKARERLAKREEEE